jgi:hypothetical protein
MKVNEGVFDRVVRVALGVALLYIGYFVVGGGWGIVLDVLGIVALVTGVVGFCPLYRLLGGLSTAKKK